jgi:hypothetical protein
MKTKTELVAKMASLGACRPAETFALEHESNSAIEIFLSCDRSDWLCWLGGRLKPALAAEYAKLCASRAPDYNAKGAAAYAVEAAAYAHDYACTAAYSAAEAAAYAAEVAARYSANFSAFSAFTADAERKVQAAWWHERAEEVLS